MKLKKLFHKALSKLIGYGRSKRTDRRHAREDHTALIYSYKTFKTYLAACVRFADWMQEHYPEIETMEEAEGYVPAYLWECREGGMSSWTVAMYACALAKAYGCSSVDFGVKTVRQRECVKRSRGEAVRDKDFSEDKNEDFVKLCISTGCRREDVEYNVHACDFVMHGDHLWMTVESGKGGRSRMALVLPEYQNDVLRILEAAKAERGEDGVIFPRVASHADIHGFRRLYASKLYSLCAENEMLCMHLQHLLNVYPQKKNPVYYGRGVACGESWNRAALVVVSACLGHGEGREDTVVNSYLR